jgi:hypothetical protein
MKKYIDLYLARLKTRPKFNNCDQAIPQMELNPKYSRLNDAFRLVFCNILDQLCFVIILKDT